MRYGMPRFEFAEEIFCRTRAAPAGIFQTLANALASVSLCGDVEQALISLHILNHGSSFAVHCEYDWPLALLDLLKEYARIATKCGQRLDVGWNVEHDLNYMNLACASQRSQVREWLEWA